MCYPSFMDSFFYGVTEVLPLATEKKKKKCPICGKEKSIKTGFYKSYSPLYSEDGCVPICTTCVKNGMVNEDGTINQPKFRRMLQRLDKPLYWDTLESSYAQFKREHSFLSEDEIARNGKEIVGLYFKNVMMRQNRGKSFADSEKMDLCIRQAIHLWKVKSKSPESILLE